MQREKFLLAIDCQNDFVLESGALSVPGAMDDMDALLHNLLTREKNLGYGYFGTVMTLDMHPVNHCSFKENGGIWPAHCVRGTNGSRPYFDLTAICERLGSKIAYVEKGCDADKEEYGADAEKIYKEFGMMLGISGDSDPCYQIDVDIVGIMSEYCVLETTKNLVSHIKEKCGDGYKPKIRLLLPFISTMDNHEKLKAFAEANADIIELVSEVK